MVSDFHVQNCYYLTMPRVKTVFHSMAPLRKIKEKSRTPWYNEHTRTLNRVARKMERSWRKTKLEVFRIARRKSTLSY